jgi:hypothetical protein
MALKKEDLMQRMALLNRAVEETLQNHNAMVGRRNEVQWLLDELGREEKKLADEAAKAEAEKKESESGKEESISLEAEAIKPEHTS